VNTLLLNVVHRAATDADFRAQLQANPRQALLSSNMTFDEETLVVIDQMLQSATKPSKRTDPLRDPDWAINIPFTSFALGKATN
jgi:hypothetical protein